MNEPDQNGLTGVEPDAVEGDIHCFGDEAMATTWGISITGVEEEYADQAASAAFEELHLLETRLTRFDPCSEISQISQLQAGQGVRVTIETFNSLVTAFHVHMETGGAFDVTLGRLQDLWWSKDRAAAEPADEEIAEILENIGMQMLVFDEEDFAVGVRADHLQIDLGGIGKGCAVDHMVAILKEWDIESALVHGGRSTVFGMGTPPDKEGWPIAAYGPDREPGTIGSVTLLDRALSGSGSPPGERHVLDPRIGRPAIGNLGAWAVTDNAMESDALATAFLVMSPDEVQEYCGQHPAVSGMLLREEDGEVHRFGCWEIP